MYRDEAGSSIRIIQVRGVSGLDQGGSCENGGTWLDIQEIFEDTAGYTFKVVRKGSQGSLHYYYCYFIFLT